MGDRVSLSVGGHTFETSMTTITKDPHSLLAKLAHHDLSTSRSAFIDRDGTHFRYILNFLRDGSCVLPSSEQHQQELRIEAEYFQVQGLTEFMSTSQESDPVEPISTGLEDLTSLKREAQGANFVHRLRQKAGPAVIDYVVRFLIEAAFAKGLMYNHFSHVFIPHQNVPTKIINASSSLNVPMQAVLVKYFAVFEHDFRKLGYTLTHTSESSAMVGIDRDM